MKRLIIACILILALTSQVYAMGSHGGGKSSGRISDSNSSAANTGNTGSQNGPMPSGQNGPLPSGQNDASLQLVIKTPELGTLFLLSSALLGLWGLRRKIKK